MIRPAFKTRSKKDCNTGFTIVELMVAIALTAALVAVIYGLYVSYSRIVIKQEERVEIQQIARMALQTMKSDLMLIGRNSRHDRGQEALAYAAPWEILFNADISSQYDALTGSMSYGGGSYVGSSSWYSPAETVHYYIHNPTTAEDFSFSPYDREIHKNINGNTGGSVLIADRIAYGIRYDDGTMGYSSGAKVPLLFTYWGDFDLNPSTPDTLWGDTSGDGTLSNTEIQSLIASSYSWSYTSESGSVNNSSIPFGAIFLGHNMSNTEDVDSDGVLDVGEDLNGNGRLDTNLLDFAVHRVVVNITTIGQYIDDTFRHPLDPNYRYREHNLRTSVDPRNLLKHVLDEEGGGPPAPPTSVTLVQIECARQLLLTFDASTDDGGGERDVLWYEVQRQVGSSGSYRYYTFIPATGAANYSLIDGDLEVDQYGHIVSISYRFRVKAVDSTDQSSTWGTSSAVIPVQTWPSQPDSAFFTSFNSPCFKSTHGHTDGSITLQWQESMTGGSADRSDVTEYWIYRSDPNDNSGVYGEPIAKAELNDLSNCAPSPASETIAHQSCVDEQFFDYVDNFGKPMLVWRDEFDSPGREGVSIIPYDGAQFGIIDGDVEEYNRYYYEVRAFNANSSSRCLSDPALLNPQCENDPFYCNSQSYPCSINAGTEDRSRYSSPRNVNIQDGSIADVNGDIHPRFIITWDESLSEHCEYTASPDNDIPDLTRYYVMRSKSFLAMQPTGPESVFRELMPAPNPEGLYSCNLDFGDPSFYSNVFTFMGVEQSETTSSYEFIDDSDFYLKPAQYPGHTAYWLSATDTLRPSTSQFSSIDSYPLTEGSGGENIYEYMVVSGNTGWATGTEPWSFGASCVLTGRFECLNNCSVAVTDTSLEQCALRSDTPGADDVTLFWQYVSGSGPSADATVYLVARDESNPTSEWVLIDDSPTLSGGYWIGIHGYDDGDTCPYVAGEGCRGQHPPTHWEYALQVNCVGASSEDDCTRFISLGQHVSAGAPDPLEICYYKQDTNCPSDATLNCQTGLMGFEFYERLDRCPTSGIQTDPKYDWFRIVRWSKPPSNNPYGDWPWCTGSYQGDPYTCGRPNIPADVIYYVRGDGSCPTPWVQTPLNPTPPYSCFPGFIELSGNKRYRFEEYVDPNLDYWYMVEHRVDHNSTSGYLTPPRCCPGHWFPSHDCPVPYNGNDTCNGGFDTENHPKIITYEHIQCYPSWSPGTYHPGTHTWEEFSAPSGFELNIEGTSSPWHNWEWTLIDFSFWGIHFYIGDHMFKYANNRIETDLESFFGDLLNWLWEWAYEIMFNMCSWCFDFWGVTLFCVDWFWPNCYDDLTYMANHSYLWSNFPAGQCGSSPGPGDPNNNEITGNFLFQYHYRARYKNKQLHTVLRGTYTPGSDSFNHYMISQDFDRAGNDISFSLGYNQATLYKNYTYKVLHPSTGDTEDEWWSCMALVCTNAVPGHLYENETFIYFWAKHDDDREWDWQQGDGPNQLFYHRPPYLSFNTIGQTAPNGLDLTTEENKDGKIGWWVQPFVDWDADNFYFDNVRVTEYCAQCPPAFTYPYTKFDGSNGMPKGWKGKTGTFAEVFSPKR